MDVRIEVIAENVNIEGVKIVKGIGIMVILIIMMTDQEGKDGDNKEDSHNHNLRLITNLRCNISIHQRQTGIVMIIL